SGGFTSNSAMVKELEGVTDYAYNSSPFSTGVGITLGKQVGGYVRGEGKYIPFFGSVLRDFDYPSVPAVSIQTQPQGRAPWEIYVNVHGSRFVREDSAHFTALEMALSKQPEQKAWVVFDQTILAE